MQGTDEGTTRRNEKDQGGSEYDPEFALAQKSMQKFSNGKCSKYFGDKPKKHTQEDHCKTGKLSSEIRRLLAGMEMASVIECYCEDETPTENVKSRLDMSVIPSEIVTKVGCFNCCKRKSKRKEEDLLKLKSAKTVCPMEQSDEGFCNCCKRKKSKKAGTEPRKKSTRSRRTSSTTTGCCDWCRKKKFKKVHSSRTSSTSSGTTGCCNCWKRRKPQGRASVPRSSDSQRCCECCSGASLQPQNRLTPPPTTSHSSKSKGGKRYTPVKFASTEDSLRKAFSQRSKSQALKPSESRSGGHVCKCGEFARLEKELCCLRKTFEEELKNVMELVLDMKDECVCRVNRKRIKSSIASESNLSLPERLEKCEYFSCTDTPRARTSKTTTSATASTTKPPPPSCTAQAGMVTSIPKMTLLVPGITERCDKSPSPSTEPRSAGHSMVPTMGTLGSVFAGCSKCGQRRESCRCQPARSASKERRHKCKDSVRFAEIPPRRSSKQLLCNQTQSFCKFCEGRHLTLLECKLAREIERVCCKVATSDVVLTVVMQPGNTYHVHVSRLSTEESLGCLLATEPCMREAAKARVFVKYFTLFVSDGSRKLFIKQAFEVVTSA